VLEETLSEHEVPFKVESGMSFFERYEVRGLIDYLRVIHNPDCDEADLALRNVANLPNRYVSRAFLNELEAYSIEDGVHFFQGLKTIPIRVPFLRHNVKGLIKFLYPLIREAGRMKPLEAIQVLRGSLDYDNIIVQDEIPSADDARIANLDQLELAAGEYRDIGSFLAHVDSFRDDCTGDDEGVVLSTVHRAKGLEWPVVFVVNMIDGLMPYKNGLIEEERRICFVALSRAMRVLHLSYPKLYFGKVVRPSQFLSEIRDSSPK
jgi:DNA helicase II / ATP-dependent DNA helicase PcrA